MMKGNFKSAVTVVYRFEKPPAIDTIRVEIRVIRSTYVYYSRTCYIEEMYAFRFWIKKNKNKQTKKPFFLDINI